MDGDVIMMFDIKRINTTYGMILLATMAIVIKIAALISPTVEFDAEGGGYYW